jgi:C4-dicarboxylate-specific signal transduction histidine kinase
VGDAIRAAVERARPRLRNARVLLEIEPGLPSIRSEPRLLADAIAQLAAQAAAAAAPGGAPTVRIAARRVASGIEISIDDEGPRIPHHVLQRVFEPFAAQGEVRGAGLGLALPLTRELAERSGGGVDAGWHEGGNRYTVTLASGE